MNRTLLATALLAATAPLAFAPAADAGELFLLGLVPFSYATDASDDGRVVAGYDGQSYWYWTRETGVVQLIGSTVPPGNSVGGSANISGDGRYMSVSTLQGKPLKAEGTIYDIDFAEFAPLGNEGFHCDGERNSVWGMSRDKRFTCGLMEQAQCSAIAYVRDETTGVRRNLGTLYFYKPSRANDVSLDGGTVCGWNDDYTGWRQGAAWVRNAQGNYVQTNLSSGGFKMSEASVVSGNGQWVYGIGRNGFNNGVVYRWSQATGVQPLGANPAGSAIGYPVAANHDGTKVLCFFGAIGSAGAFLWTAENGYIPIATLAAQAGVEIPSGWQLSQVLGMSEDALTIVGTAYGPNGSSPFVLDLRDSAQPCDADFDGDGVVGSSDLTALLGAWGSFGGDSDLTGDGLVNGQDLTALLGAWGACP